MNNADLADLIARARAGDEVAASDLLRRFEGEVRMVVRGKLPRALRSQFDSMDFVQAVWTSVLTKDGPDLAPYDNPRRLMAYLAGVARNKVFEEHRRRTQTYKYDLKREQPLYVRRGDRDVPREVPAHDPSPSQDAQAQDRLAQLLKGRSSFERQVVDLRRDGLTYEEIAQRLDVHESAVRRVVDGIRQRLEAREWQ
jgi:RNA polymerase sigma factor (sigma-70 family)